MPLEEKPPLPKRRRRPSTAKTRATPDAIDRWDRDYKCVLMRRAEYDWPTIADALGYGSNSHAHNAFRRFMKEYPRDDVESLRDLEMDRIERKAQQLEPKCEAGDPRAIEVWNKLSERRARLAGMDKPERRELTVLSKDTVAAAIEKLNAEMAAKAAQHDVDLSELEVD